MVELTFVSTQEKFCFARVHHHAIVHKPCTERVEYSLQRALHVREPVSRSRNGDLRVVCVPDSSYPEAIDLGRDVPRKKIIRDHQNNRNGSDGG